MFIKDHRNYVVTIFYVVVKNKAEEFVLLNDCNTQHEKRCVIRREKI